MAKAEGGYNYQFVKEPPDSLKCLICLSVVKQPQQHGGCGKLFCKVCIDTYKRQSESELKKVCPYCRKPLANNHGKPSLFPDLKSEQEIRSFHVRCTTGCDWTGELRDIRDHKKKDCPNTLVPCPRGCNSGSTMIVRRNKDYHLQHRCPNRSYTCEKCKQKMQFRNSKNHTQSQCPKRDHTCPHCKKAGMYDEITTTHLDVCPKATTKCPKCQLDVLRCDQPIHPAICECEPVRCKYYNIGCEEKPLRKDLTKHEENTQIHLELATKKILTLTNALVVKNTLTFKVTEFEQKKIEDKEFCSPPFFTSKNRYKMSIRIYANGLGAGKGTHVSVYAHLMKGDHDDTLTWPFTGSVTVELLNQLEDKNHYKETLAFLDNAASKRVVDDEKGGGWGLSDFISYAALNYNATTNTQYLKDDTLVFRVSAEAPEYKPWLVCTDQQ